VATRARPDAAIGGGFAGALTYHVAAALTESSTPLCSRELHDQICAKLKQARFAQVLRHGEEGRRVSHIAWRPNNELSVSRYADRATSPEWRIAPPPSDRQDKK
jgi:hypothetical protein